MTNEAQQIDFISHSDAQPSLLASFFWSERLGLKCTNTDLMGEMELNGIATPPAGTKVFPNAGRLFFEALQWRGSSYVEVTQARDIHGGNLNLPV